MLQAKPVAIIIDSEEEHRESLKRSIMAQGFNVHTFSDGGKFLNKIELEGLRAKPSFVILDVSSSGLGGFEACRRLVDKQSMNDVPIIMTARHCSAEDRIESTGAGALTCLQKPITFELIEKELAQRKERKEKSSKVAQGFKIGYDSY